MKCSLTVGLLTCPNCPTYEMSRDEEEVDIGVGIQVHLRGYECCRCGYQVTACVTCGAPDIKGRHFEWCASTRLASVDLADVEERLLAFLSPEERAVVLETEKRRE